MPLASPAPSSSGHLVVGIGGSAGGLEAFSELLRSITADANLAVVIIQHLSPEHQSLLVELLGRVSPVPVHWIENGVLVAARHVYVAPASMAVALHDGRFMLNPKSAASGVIDASFRALAEEFKERAVGVILSGNGFDGTAGLKAIKAAGGITFSQDESTAGFPGMPHAAIEAGCADRVLAPDEIGRALVALAEHSQRIGQAIQPADDAGPQEEAEQLHWIFRLLASRTGIDFSQYKQSTIKRRIARRMALTMTDRLSDYVALLRRDDDEITALNDTLLINVTEFFRDPESFDFLRENVLPQILAQHEDESPIRVWVPGCSTGEEAYSLAILFAEVLEAAGRGTPVQIFATDASERAIALARAGLYSAADLATLSPDRVRRFFQPGDRGFIVRKSVRDRCIFARQNVVRDSPFSRLDLVSCRNLLIYLSPALHRKLMPVFHYALAPHGYLFLGSSESAGSHPDLFRLIDRRHRIYEKKSSTRRPPFEFSTFTLSPDVNPPSKPLSTMPSDPKEPFDAIREADRLVVSRHGPDGVLVDDDLEILQFRGDVSRYLAPLPGRPSHNLLKMAREGLAIELQSAIQEARDSNARVMRTGVAVVENGVPRPIELDITPLEVPVTKQRCFLVLFLTAAPPPAQPAPEAPGAGSEQAYHAQIAQLTRELQATRAYLQATIEQHEETNHELRAANEEIQSSNEELQSTNEELETAKEELQSTNEELTTVNEELHSRQLELMQLNNDLQNLINSVQLPIVILDSALRIRRFTPMAEKVLNVIPTDVGRPVTDINTNLNIPDLAKLITEVMDSLSSRELEVQDKTGRWYSLRIRPYKTAENKIDGVVLTLIDIDPLERTITELEEARNLAQAVTDSNRDPLAVLTDKFTVMIANRAFYTLTGTRPEEVLGHSFLELLPDDFRPDFHRALAEVLPQSKVVGGLKLSFDATHGARKEVSVNARQIFGAKRTYPYILVSVDAAAGAR